MELCDRQNEENAQRGIKPEPRLKPYVVGEGPNPGFHDNGIGVLKKTQEKEEYDEQKRKERFERI